MSYRHFKNFIDDEETTQIVDWVSGLDFSIGKPNYHLDKLSKSLNGGSVMFDISKTDLTNYITEFQSISSVIKSEIPQFIYTLRSKISAQLEIPVDHSFLQVVDMSIGGKVTFDDISYAGDWKITINWPSFGPPPKKAKKAKYRPKTNVQKGVTWENVCAAFD
jgi:hypothetical protein